MTSRTGSHSTSFLPNGVTAVLGRLPVFVIIAEGIVRKLTRRTIVTFFPAYFSGFTRRSCFAEPYHPSPTYCNHKDVLCRWERGKLFPQIDSVNKGQACGKSSLIGRYAYYLSSVPVNQDV